MDLLQMPDVAHILLDGTVRGEFTSACCVEHGCSRPPVLVTVSCLDAFLRFRIGTEIFQDEVGICLGTVLCI